MSINVTTCVEVEAEAVEVEANCSDVAVSASTYDVSVDASELEVSAVKKEYSVVGDSLYASIDYDEAPTWLTSIIDDVVDSAVSSSLTGYETLTQDIRDAIDAIDVAANSYVQEINFDASVDAIVASALTTFNATLDTTYATIVDLDTVVADQDYALTSAISDLTAAYTEEINSQITTIETAYSDADSALASDITALTAAFTSQETGLTSLADIVENMQTYVGIDDAGASTFTNLSAYIENSYGVIGGAESAVTNNVYTNSDGDSESQFEYTSTLYKDSAYYLAGFGLVTSTDSGSGTEEDPYSSEFWINAEKFSFTNSATTGSVSPFTIDASGTTPEIYFNGVVSFSNTMAQQLGYADYDDLVTNATSGNTIISGGLINTDLITVQTAIASSDGLMYADMENKVIRLEDDSGDYSLHTPAALTYNYGGVDMFEYDSGVVTIRNQDGSTLLQSGGTLSVDDISGLGDLATAVEANYWTYLSNAITNNFVAGTANIGNAAVDTLQIKGEAVVVPRSVSSTTGISTNSGTTTVLTTSLSLDNANQPILITGTVKLNCSCSNGYSDYAEATAYIYVNGSSVATIGEVDCSGASSQSDHDTFPFAITTTDTVAGSNTISLVVIGASYSGSSSASRRYMIAMGVQV